MVDDGEQRFVGDPGIRLIPPENHLYFLIDFFPPVGIELVSAFLAEGGDLGMGIAFTDNADFSGMHPDLYISKVDHKAVIEVNEKGSEAAAVTVVEMKLTSAPADPIEFTVDKPFFFVIADDRTGSILFMGKVVNPVKDFN